MDRCVYLPELCRLSSSVSLSSLLGGPSFSCELPSSSYDNIGANFFKLSLGTKDTPLKNCENHTHYDIIIDDFIIKM